MKVVYWIIDRLYEPFATKLNDECPVDALRACVFIYLSYILKNNVEFRRK